MCHISVRMPNFSWIKSGDSGLHSCHRCQKSNIFIRAPCMRCRITELYSTSSGNTNTKTFILSPSGTPFIKTPGLLLWIISTSCSLSDTGQVELNSTGKGVAPRLQMQLSLIAALSWCHLSVFFSPSGDYIKDIKLADYCHSGRPRQKDAC